VTSKVVFEPLVQAFSARPRNVFLVPVAPCSWTLAVAFIRGPWTSCFFFISFPPLLGLRYLIGFRISADYFLELDIRIWSLGKYFSPKALFVLTVQLVPRLVFHHL